MNLQHIAVKLFAKSAPTAELPVFIRVFHGWIQRKALTGLMPIDVADYTHVHHGPGVMLICHEGHLALEQGDGQLGLTYANKRLAAGSTQDRLGAALQHLLNAAKLLESESASDVRMTFHTGRLQLQVHDRVHAPNTDDTLATLRSDVEAVMKTLFGDGPVTIERVGDDRSALTINVTASVTDDLTTLIARIT